MEALFFPIFCLGVSGLINSVLILCARYDIYKLEERVETLEKRIKKLEKLILPED